MAERIKTEVFQLRLAPMDKALLRELAKKHQMSIAEYLRYLIRKESQR